MKNSLLQVRVDEIDKKKASVIADSLGMDLSTVVNMLLKQMIIQNKIPFEIKGDDDLEEIIATEMLEGCFPSKDVVEGFNRISNGTSTTVLEIERLNKKYKES